MTSSTSNVSLSKWHSTCFSLLQFQWHKRTDTINMEVSDSWFYTVSLVSSIYHVSLLTGQNTEEPCRCSSPFRFVDQLRFVTSVLERKLKYSLTCLSLFFDPPCVSLSMIVFIPFSEFFVFWVCFCFLLSAKQDNYFSLLQLYCSKRFLPSLRYL